MVLSHFSARYAKTSDVQLSEGPTWLLQGKCNRASGALSRVACHSSNSFCTSEMRTDCDTDTEAVRDTVELMSFCNFFVEQPFL